MSLVFDIWRSVVTGYTIPATLPMDADEKRAFENNAKSDECHPQWSGRIGIC